MAFIGFHFDNLIFDSKVSTPLVYELIEEVVSSFISILFKVRVLPQARIQLESLVRNPGEPVLLWSYPTIEGAVVGVSGNPPSEPLDLWNWFFSGGLLLWSERNLFLIQRHPQGEKALGGIFEMRRISEWRSLEDILNENHSGGSDEFKKLVGKFSSGV